MYKQQRINRNISFILIFALIWSLFIPLFPQPVQSQGLDNSNSIQNERVELTEYRTASSKRFQNSDGTLTEEIYLENIHYNNNGKWEDIDNTLIPANNSDFAYTNKANSFNVEFANENKGNSFVRYGIEDRTVDIRPIGMLVSAAQVNGNKITYPKGNEGAGLPVKLEYTVGNNILKEDIILDSYQKINRFTFQLKLTNVTYQEETDGTIVFYDQETNEQVFMFTKPYMVDNNEAFSDKVTM